MWSGWARDTKTTATRDEGRVDKRLRRTGVALGRGIEKERPRDGREGARAERSIDFCAPVAARVDAARVMNEGALPENVFLSLCIHGVE